MKITNSNTIKTSEKELINAINKNLDWEIIKKILLEKHKFTLKDEIKYKKGDLIVYNNQIAYKLDFDFKVLLSVIFGRDGNCLKCSTSGDQDFIESSPENKIKPKPEIDVKPDNNDIKIEKQSQEETDPNMYETQDTSTLDIEDMISDIKDTSNENSQIPENNADNNINDDDYEEDYEENDEDDNFEIENNDKEDYEEDDENDYDEDDDDDDEENYDEDDDDDDEENYDDDDDEENIIYEDDNNEDETQ
ncbi:MAG: hypothetical protein B6I26_01655 [Desulfobacteraceae bacterium 4572_130]|nr:MAG: hypothetical protein B6I26_01655 [Desulfobacteraceae bacterium 4572_130]